MLRVLLTVTAAVMWAVVALIALERALLGSRDESDGEAKWQGHPVLSAAIVGVAYVVPIAAGVTTASLLSRSMAQPHGFWATTQKWTILLVVSTIAVFLVDRLARRLLPLAALLKLSLLFPDKAPPRLAVARQAGSTRGLQRRLDHARAHGIDGEPVEVAEKVLALVGALHAHDRHTRGHAERVRVLTDLVADELKLPPEDRDRLRWSSLLHDIGKLHVSPKILNKAGKPDPHEWEAIHKHPIEGMKLVAPLAPWLGQWAATIEQHHERWDGTGYPHALSGEQISLGARIVGVADAYEVMTAARSYKKAKSASWARQELTRCAGTHFDPTIVRAFLHISIGRLRLAIGPAAWLAQLPFIGWLPRAADGAAALTGQAAGVVGSAAGAAVITAGATMSIGAAAPSTRHSAVIEVPAIDVAALPADGILVASPLVPGEAVVLAVNEERAPNGAHDSDASSQDAPAPSHAEPADGQAEPSTPAAPTHDKPARGKNNEPQQKGGPSSTTTTTSPEDTTTTDDTASSDSTSSDGTDTTTSPGSDSEDEPGSKGEERRILDHGSKAPVPTGPKDK